jgi:predicted metal-dependent hydrolase
MRRHAAPFGHGTILPMRGVDHRIEHRSGSRGTVWAETNAAGENLLCVAGDERHVPRRVRDYLKRQAKTDLEAASRRAADELGVTLKRVAVRDQSSRWGSCSTTGVLRSGGKSWASAPRWTAPRSGSMCMAPRFIVME